MPTCPAIRIGEAQRRCCDHGVGELGARSPELALQLLFTAWDSQEQGSEPLDDDVEPDELFAEIFHHLGGSQSDNAEFLLVAGHMITLFFWQTGLEIEEA